MCGIIGYIGLNNSVPYLVSGIKKLEYRGYDSFGCACRSENGLQIFKSTRNIEDGVREYNIDKLKSKTAIFHTRWATNGRINETNAHPQLDCTGKIAVVHNGIVENAQELKTHLVKHRFLSETDTEVIPHLIEENMETGNSFYEATIISAKRILGMSSFVVIHSEINEMIAVKNGSPLILAIDRSGYFISSDIPSVINRTNKIIYLNDGDTVHLTESTYSIENIYDLHNKHEVVRVYPDSSNREVSKYPHLMVKEIFEQLSIWGVLPEPVVSAIKKTSSYIQNTDRVFFVGSGSSYHVSLYGSMMFRKCGKDAMAIQPQEIPDFRNIMRSNDLVIVVSQSGETADIIYYLKQIPENKKIGIINVEQSYIANNVDILIPMSVGLERAVAATKSVSNSLMIVTYLYIFLSGGTEFLERDTHLLELNKFNLIVPSVESKIEEIAELLKCEDHIFITGTEEGYILAMEGALKLKEVTYIHAEALDLVALKHGPLAMVEDGTKIIVIIGSGNYSRNIDELKARGATIIGIAEKKYQNFDYFIRTVPAGKFSFAPVLFILQLLSYDIAVKKGLNPDKPRNLAKSVTVR